MKKLITFFFCISLFIVSTQNVSAVKCNCTDGQANVNNYTCTDCSALGCKLTGFTCTAATPSSSASATTLPNPLKETNPNVIIGKIISAVLGIVGSLALAMFVYGGLIWMTAAGNADRVTKGRQILVWAAVGLIVIFSSYGLVKLVLTGIGALT